MRTIQMLMFVWASFFVLIEANTVAADGFDRTVQRFLSTYCAHCHNDKKQEGEFRLDTLLRDFGTQEVAERWSEVVFRMNAGEMPPKQELQPSAEELGKVVEAITTLIKQGEAERMARRSLVSHYRLSRDEYANTVADLLGVQYDVHLPGAFNDEPRWRGFERIGSMLSLSPSHIDRYMKAAEVVLERAFPDEQPTTMQRRFDAIEMRHRQSREKIEKLGIAQQVRAVIWPGGRLDGFRGCWSGDFKESGVYRCRVQLSGLPGLDGLAPHLTVWHTTLKKSLFDEDVLAVGNYTAISKKAMPNTPVLPTRRLRDCLPKGKK